MAAAATPIKVDQTTDDLISHAAHFLERSKKDVVDTAVREYIENHRDEINAGVRAALTQLDGSTASAVSLLTGFDASKLGELGGLKEPTELSSRPGSA
jgi:predicted transcriptional regulator